MKKLIFRNTVSLSLSRFVAKIVNVVAIILITRHLGSSDFGIYSYALSLTALFVIFVDFGFNDLMIRNVARNKSNVEKYVGNILVLKSVFSVIGLILLILLIYLSDQSELMLAIIFVYMFSVFTSFSNFYKAVFQAFERMEYHTLSTVLEKIAWFLFILLAVTGNFGLVGLLLMIMSSAFLGLVMTSIILKVKFCKPVFSFDRLFAMKILKDAWSFLLIGVFVIIYFKIDILMLTYFKNFDVVGLYNSAYKLIDTVIIIPAVIAGATFPALSRLSDKKKLKTIFDDLKKYLLLLSIPSGAIIYLFSSEIVVLLYGNEFLGAAFALKILVFAIPLIFLSYIYGAILSARDFQKKVLFATGLGAFLNIVLNFFLIPVFSSYEGAAYATVITELFVLSIQYYYFRKYLVAKGNFNILWKIFVAFIFIVFFLNFTKNLFFPITAIVLAMCLYVSILPILRLITKKDFEVFKGLLKK